MADGTALQTISKSLNSKKRKPGSNADLVDISREKRLRLETKAMD